jgi:hypothetical protein
MEEVEPWLPAEAAVDVVAERVGQSRLRLHREDAPALEVDDPGGVGPRGHRVVLSAEFHDAQTATLCGTVRRIAMVSLRYGLDAGGTTLVPVAGSASVTAVPEIPERFRSRSPGAPWSRTETAMLVAVEPA